MYGSGAGTALPCDKQKRLAREDAERAPELRVVPVRHWMRNDRGEDRRKGAGGHLSSEEEKRVDGE